MCVRSFDVKLSNDDDILKKNEFLFEFELWLMFGENCIMFETSTNAQIMHAEMPQPEKDEKLTWSSSEPMVKTRAVSSMSGVSRAVVNVSIGR